MSVLMSCHHLAEENSSQLWSVSQSVMTQSDHDQHVWCMMTTSYYDVRSLTD